MSRNMITTVGVCGLLMAAVIPTVARTSGTTPDSAARVRVRTVPLLVENDNFLDVHIYAVRGGVFHSVGMVQSFTKQEFRLEDAWVGPGDDFRLFADPIGGIGGYLSEPILVDSNQTLLFTVKESLNLSNVTVRSAT